MLQKAWNDGKLSRKGKSLYRKYEAVYPELDGRAGLLTPVGEAQQRGIAARMFSRYHELFERDTIVYALSSDTQRTVASMETFCTGLHAEMPRLVISKSSDTSQIAAINPYSSISPVITPDDLKHKSTEAGWRGDFDIYCSEKIDIESIIGRLFTDTSYVQSVCNPADFVRNLFSIAVHLPGIPSDVDLLRYFTMEEAEAIADCETYPFYMEKGPYPHGNQRNWKLSAYILEDIIDKTRSDLSEPETAARLRFGHDGCIMSLLCLMDIGTWGTETDDPDEFPEVWDVSQICMGCNLQFVFYENPEGESIMQMLMNEKPLRLPLDDCGTPFFYDTETFLSHYSKVTEDAIDDIMGYNSYETKYHD